MEIARCPGCGATARAQATWCSLCYRDLRPPSQLVRAAGTRHGALTASEGAAPLVEASLEPGPVRWSEVGVAAGDAEVVDRQQAARDGQAASARHWPCGCGTWVAFDRDECPTCGAHFLGDLRAEASGRHRQGFRRHSSWMPESRALRLGLAAFVALLIAVAVPVLLTLLG